MESGIDKVREAKVGAYHLDFVFSVAGGGGKVAGGGLLEK